jgi:hypothetical protein
VVKPEEKRPIRRTRHRWDNVKMDLRAVGFDDMNPLNLDEFDRWRALVNTVTNLRDS